MLLLAFAAAHAAPPKPWQGFDQPTPNTIVNTLTGVPMTALHLAGWKAQGIGIDYTLYHSPDCIAFSPAGLYGRPAEPSKAAPPREPARRARPPLALVIAFVAVLGVGLGVATTLGTRPPAAAPPAATAAAP